MPAKNNADPQNLDCKVVLLGKENVGKTCLMERFVYDRFINSSESQSTVGVVFGAKQVLVSNNSVRLSLWDTAGSERFTSISRLYYRNAKAAIVCYDVTESASFDRCLFWIEELKKTEENCRIYLVGTKLDLVQENPRNRRIQIPDVERLSRGKYRIGFFHYPIFHDVNNSEVGAMTCETSARNGVGIQELFATIAKDFVDNLPIVIPDSNPDDIRLMDMGYGDTDSRQDRPSRPQKRKCFSNCSR